MHEGFSNFFHFKVGKTSIIHSGDNTRWMQFAKSKYAKNIDVLLFKPESMYPDQTREDDHRGAMAESLRKLSPKLLIPHHLLELGHGLGAYSYDLGKQVGKCAPDGTKVLILHWGESITLGSDS